jgi:predicted DNA-binding transcriptional regulator YafY
VDPYALVFRRHNWYLIAFSHTHSKPVQLKAVRMVEASETGDGFQTPSDFSVDAFYANSWEMWAGGDEHTVRIRFSPQCAPLMRETKRHPTQELADTPDGGVILTVRVSGIEEIGFWIMSYGSEAEVLDPPELRTIIKEHVLRMGQVYAEESEDEGLICEIEGVLAREP